MTIKEALEIMQAPGSSDEVRWRMLSVVLEEVALQQGAEIDREIVDDDTEPSATGDPCLCFTILLAFAGGVCTAGLFYLAFLK